MATTNNFFDPTLTLIRENYHIWAIQMKVYPKGLSLWEVVENGVDPIAFP